MSSTLIPDRSNRVEEQRFNSNESVPPGSHCRLFLKWILIAAGSLPLMVLTLELGARLMYDACIPKLNQTQYHQFIDGKLMGGAYYWAYRPHPYTVFEPNPGYALRNGEVLHTADAFRFPEMSPAKPVGTYRIALLGGSVTYENDTPMKQTFGAYLEEYAGGIFPDRRIEILNAAVGGYNSADGFARFHFKVLDYSPDMVLINFDVNDIWPRAFAKEFTNDYRNARIIMSQRHNPTPTELKWLRRSAFLRVLYFRYVLKGALPNIMEMTYVSSNTALYMENFKRSSSSAFRRNIEDMVYIAKGRGITPVLVTTPLHATMYKPDDPYYVLVLGGREHNEVVRDIAQKENVTLIDLEKMIPGNSTYLGDVCHLTWRGNRLRAKLIADALAPFLEKQFGATAQPYPWPIEELNAPPPAVLKR